MKILNASIVEIADTFLHPGYISAYVEVTEPGAMTAAIVPVDKEPVVQIDLAVALRLTPAMRQATGGGTVPRQHEPAAPASPWLALAVIALALAHGARLAHRGRAVRRSPRLLGAAAVVALVAAVACGKGPAPDVTGLPAKTDESLPAPKGSPEVLADPSIPFQNPRAATEAILNGIVADAVACSPAPVIAGLDSVRSQVGLPAGNKTPGMRWAVTNYQDDGWGRPFQFRALAKDRYEVTSAAEDGAFGTGDDVTLEVRRASRALDWPRRLRAFYLRREHDDVGVSFHRCGPGGTRRMAVEPTARGLTGDALFGLIAEQEFPGVKREALRARIERVTGSRERDALVLLVFDPKQVGRPDPRTVMVPRW